MILITLRAPTLSSGTIILMSIAPVTLTRAGQLRALARNVALDSNLPAMPDAFALRLMRPVRTIEHRVTLTLQYQNTVEYVGDTQFGFR